MLMLAEVKQGGRAFPNQSKSVKADLTSASIKLRASSLMSTKSSEIMQCTAQEPKEPDPRPSSIKLSFQGKALYLLPT